MILELTCHPGITSCINEGPVAVDEIVYVYTVEGQFTDEEYPGWVRATVTEAWKDCGCWNYKLELFEEDLPSGIANLSLCDIANIGCAELECPPCTALEAPENFTATPTCLEDQLVLEWDEVEGRTGFEIQSSPSDDPFVWTEVLHLPLGSPELNAFALEGENDTWWFRVRAYRETEDCPEEVSAWTQVSGMPAQHGFPTEFAAVAVSDEQIDLSWVDNASSETGFEIERSLDGETGWALVLTPAANATSDSDTGLDPDTEYFYRIRAVGEDDTFSCWSEVVSATTEETIPTVPEAPSLLDAHAISDSEIDLTWQDNSDDETGFEIERSPDGIGGWTQVLTPAADATSDTDTGLDAETEYCYRIRAVNGVGPSAWSNVACDTTLGSGALAPNYHWRSEDFETVDTEWVDFIQGNVNAKSGDPQKIADWDTLGVPAIDFDGNDSFPDVSFPPAGDFYGGSGVSTTVIVGKTDVAETLRVFFHAAGGLVNFTVSTAENGGGDLTIVENNNGVTLPFLRIADQSSDVLGNRFILVFTRNSNVITVYFQSEVLIRGSRNSGSFNGSAFSGSGSINIGGWSPGSDHNGQLAEVMIFDSVLSEGDINGLMDTLAVIYDVTPTPGTWVSRSNPVDNQWSAVTHDGAAEYDGTGNIVASLFVAVAISGTGDRVMTSPDGVTWTSRTSAADNDWRAIAHGNGLFVAVASSGTGDRVMTSPDGETWTIRTSAADNFWKGVAFGNGVFVAVAQDGTGDRVMTSPDGITWTSRNAAEENAWNGITYADSLGLFVAVASSGVTNRVMTSPDGETWTARAASHDLSWQSVAWSGSILVAVASNGNEDERVMTSPDGINWTQRVSPIASGSPVQWQHVTWGAGHFVAVGTTGSGDRVMSSPDGINWTIHNSAADNAWLGVEYGAGKFVAVAASGTGDRVMTASG